MVTLNDHLLQLEEDLLQILIKAIPLPKSIKVPKLEKTAKTKVIKIIKFRQKNSNPKRIIPSTYSNNKYERSLGIKLSRLKTAKNKGTGGCKFYHSLQTLAEANSDPKLFEYVNNKQKAITKLISCLEKVKLLGKFPTEKEDYDTWKFIKNLQSVKEGKLQGIWYPELDSIALEYGHPNLFKTNIVNTMVNVDIKDLMKFYRKHNRNPSQLSKNKEERDLYRKLIRLKQIKQGKTVQQWNPELDLILKHSKMKNIFT